MSKKDSRARFAAMRASLRLPVVVAPMFLVSGPDLVTAACRSGVIGSFPAPNARTIDVFEEWLDKITGEIGNMKKNQVAGATDVWAPGADSQDGGAEGPNLTLNGH